MIKSNKKVLRLVAASILTAVLLLAGSCNNWMSNDDFMETIESEVHDANASAISVYVRYANANMGTTEPQGNTTMKVDVPSRLSAVTSDDYGFVKWAAFSTKDFATNKNHNIIYVGEETYNSELKEKELPSSEVFFTNPGETTTDVKIQKQRDDIFIIPIVAERPKFIESRPIKDSEKNVKNTSIKIRFSKAMDEKTIYDEEGLLNYMVTTSSISGNIEDDNTTGVDITDMFDAAFNTDGNGKVLKLTLKEGKKLGNNQRISVTIFEGIRDKDNFSMKGNYTFEFSTGTKEDSLAPIIEILVGGTGEIRIGELASFSNAPQYENATDASINAPKNINNSIYTSELLTQRVKDKLNIYVKANDIISSGNVTPTKENTDEDNVMAIGISASLYIENTDSKGRFVTANRDDLLTAIKAKTIDYSKEDIVSDYEVNKLFEEIVPLDETTNTAYTGGTIITYDVSSLPDGLIRIDVWGIDNTGNSGEKPGEEGSPYYKTQDNGFKSIFVIKDSTAPDILTEANKVKTSSVQAPYGWYNNSTIKTIQLYDLDDNQILDLGIDKLSSLPKNLEWKFVVGTNDSGWQPIHDKTTGAGIKYDLTTAQAPTKDGPVDITFFIRDDMGNTSEPAKLPSVMYDNTKPTVTLKKGKGDFVKATGEDTLHVSESDVINQILKVTIGETNENNAGSGIRRLELHVKKDGQEVAVPLDPTTFKVKYAPATVANPTPDSATEIGIVAAGKDPSMANLDEDKIKVFNVTDSNKITSGTLFIYGITLGDTDGAYEISVDLYDSALNKTPVTAVTSMARDTTVPEIKTVQVMDVKARKVYGANEETWWLPYDRFENANSLSKVTLKVTANESGSGLEYLRLADNAEFTENTRLYVGDKLLERGTAYELDTATRTIHLLDWYTPELKNANGESSHVITIENVKLNNINTPAGTTQGNKIKFTVDDFVGKSKSESTITYGNTSVTGDVVHADSVAPQIATLTVEDSAKHTTNNPDSKAYDKDNYTDSQTVILYLTLGNTEAGNKGSGVDKVILSDNAVFTGNTEIYVVDGSTETKLTLSTDYEIAADNKSVTFKKVFTETNKLKFTNVNIISAVNGPQIIKADVQDFAGIKSVTSEDTNAITFDNVAPEVVQNDQQNDVKWIPNPTVTGVTTGQEKDMTVDTQSLKIDFTEATAGIKVIKFDIHHDAQPKTNSYGKPFDNANFAITYTSAEGTKPLVKGTDYEILSNNADTNIKQYIKLNSTYKSGSFIFDNLTLTNGNTQGNYVVEVLLLDAAENKVDCNKVITIDTVRPEITTTLSIPDLVSAKELTTGSTPVLGAAEGTFWLPQTYVDKTGATTDHAPTEIPVYITIKEEGSGIKVITFQESAVLSATNTKLFTVSGTTETEFDLSKYKVDETKKTITITDTGDCFKSASEFKLLVRGVGFANTDTTTAASANSIKVKVWDVAMWGSEPMGTPEPTIYSDSRKPDAPQSLTLTDRRSSAATKTISAAAGYTNEDIVDMTFTLTDSEKYGSGYHKFVLNGATFIDDDSADKTTMTIKVGNTAISDAEFAISDDGKTLTLKKTGQSDDVHAVIRQAVSVELKNVKLDNGTTDGSKTVSLTAYDMTGWPSAAASYTIILDTGIPAIVGNGPFVANHKVGTSPSYYYNPAINVYPHVSSDIETVYGTPVNSIPTFYTATSYSSSGVSQVNGQISLSSPAQYGVVLGFRVTDTYKVRGYNNNDNFMYYKADTNFSLTAEEILSGGTSLYYGSSNRITPSASYTAASTNYALWFGFTPGNYSAVVLDSAGNVSNVFRFSVVQDTTKPANTDLNERVLLQMPDSSAKAYKNGSVVTSDDISFKAYNTSSTSSNYIRNKKYIIKKSPNGKYKIQLNLNGTYSANTPIEKIGGSAASTMNEYSDLFAKAGSAPIEKYAISTWYGRWPSTIDSSYTYQPVVPYGTNFPSGQSHTSDSTALGRDYFGYTANYTSYWRAHSDYTSWHTYTKNSSRVTDSGNGIVSYVDSNNNLIIEIPDDRKTAPISVFLQDGCGNINYVVCGLYKDNNEKDIAVSFITDTKLGYASTTNGQVSTPIIMQNPYMTYVTSSPSVAWPLKESTSGFTWNKNTGNGNQGGEGQRRGFIKDYVKYATYYNPNIDYSDTDRQYKIGLTLNYDTESYQRGSPEDVLFDSDLGRIVNPNPDSSDTSISDYSVRALLYCTQSSTKPTYEQIISAAANTKNTYGGYRTEWIGVRASNDDSQRDDSTEENPKYKETGITILLDYPKPDYTSLDWTTNETNGEPKPYYIWYIFEDRVGNYEIAKIVNSNASGTELTTTTSGMFDRWFYDNEAPKLTIRGTSTNPNTITAANIGQLVATNNGFEPYAEKNSNGEYTGNVYVRATTTSGTANTNKGTGTTHLNDYDSNSIYAPFVDVSVTERTGIRAFAWTTTSSYPSLSSYADDNGWFSGNYWSIGYGPINSSGGLAKNIGESFTYSGKPGNAYFDSNISTNYSGKYSGIKVNTVIPSGKLSTSSASELYLHIMDWTGNINTYKMGASGVKFIDDSTAPVYQTSTAEKIEPGQYYIKKSESVPLLKIAGAGEKASNQEDIDVYIPEGFFAEAGSGIKGYSFNGDGTGIAEKVGGKPYLTIPYNKYHGETSDTYYVYDNIGNVKEVSINYDFDNEAPKIKSVAFVTKLETSNQGNFCDAEEGLGTQTVNDFTYTAFGSVRFYNHKDKNSNEEEINTIHADVSHFKDGEVQEIYINKAGIVKFQVNFEDKITTETDYLDDIQINRWNASTNKWETLTSWKSNNTSWWTGGLGTVIRAMGTDDDTGYGTLTYTADGTYYQILATDISGNASCQYFKLYLDTAGPTFTEQPELIITTGSVNKINDSGEYAYTSTSNKKAKLTVKIADTGIGTIKNNFEYKIDNGAWTAFTGTSFTYEFNGDDIDEIYLKDFFGNVSTVSTNFTYKKDASTIAEDITKLVYYDKDALAALNFNKNYLKIETKGSSYREANFDRMSGNVIVIKDPSTGARSHICITFHDFPDNVLDIIESSTTPSPAIGTYSLLGDDYSMQTQFEYKLSDIFPDKNTDVSKDYYAIDYAGNVSEKLTITYTYKNPHKAQNVEFLPKDSDKITSALSEALAADNITLATTKSSNDGKTIYYGNGYALIRCTLFANTADYVDNPVSLSLFEGNSNTKIGNDISWAQNNTGDLKRYLFGEAAGDRFYCYLAFPITADYSDKKLWCTINGTETASDKQNLTSSAVTWKQDIAGPDVTDTLYDDTEGHGRKLWGYTHSKDGYDYVNGQTISGYYSAIDQALEIVRDNQIGKDYGTNLYVSGMKVYIKKSDITDAAGVAQYKFVTVYQPKEVEAANSYTANANDTTYAWTDMADAPDTNYYAFVLPGISKPHTHLALFFKDELGNVSQAYYLGHNKAINDENDNNNNYGNPYQVQWWLVDGTINSSTPTITAPANGWQGANSYTFDVTPAEGSIIKSVTAKVGGTAVNVTEIVFNDYDKNNKPSLNGTKGWVNISGIKVTLDMTGVTQDFTAKDVVITLNGTVNVTSSGFVPVKKLSDGDITLSPPEWDKDTTTYLIPIVFSNGASYDNLNNQNFTSSVGDVSLENGNFKITGVTTKQTWEDQPVTISISGGNVEGTITKTALTIKKLILSEDDIEIADAVESEGKYTVLLTLKNGAPESEITSVEADNGVAATREGTLVTLNNLPAPGETDIVITLTVNGSISKAVLTITGTGAGGPNPNFYSGLFRGVSPTVSQGTNRVYGSNYTGSALLGTSYSQVESPLEAAQDVPADEATVSEGTVEAAVSTAVNKAAAKADKTVKTAKTSKLEKADDSLPALNTKAKVIDYSAAAEEKAVKTEAVGEGAGQKAEMLAEATPAQHSAAAIWVVIIAVIAAAAGIWVGCKKRRILV